MEKGHIYEKMVQITSLFELETVVRPLDSTFFSFVKPYQQGNNKLCWEGHKQTCIEDNAAV